MKVIFLDIDGVLNTHKSVGRFGVDFIDSILTSLVKTIVSATNAHIVLSSTWRLDPRDLELVKLELKQHGLELYDVTPYNKKERSSEIQLWLENNPVDTFAIIDDDIDAKIDGSFFHTDPNRGLTVKMAQEIIDHLLKG